jgi:hypothetical protein
MNQEIQQSRMTGVTPRAIKLGSASSMPPEIQLLISLIPLIFYRIGYRIVGEEPLGFPERSVNRVLGSEISEYQ